jgi:hypothetical protein
MSTIRLKPNGVSQHHHDWKASAELMRWETQAPEEEGLRRASLHPCKRGLTLV